MAEVTATEPRKSRNWFSRRGSRQASTANAPGTVEKAAVDELAGDECVVGHLQAPAQKGVDEEKKECFVHSGRLLSGLSVL